MIVKLESYRKGNKVIRDFYEMLCYCSNDNKYYTFGDFDSKIFVKVQDIPFNRGVYRCESCTREIVLDNKKRSKNER